MNKKIKAKLTHYFNELEIDELFNKIKVKQRANIINEKYFAKIGKNSDELFFNNLKKEIELYILNKNNNNLPYIVDYYIDDEYCLLILNVIKGKTIGSSRNQFNLRLNKKDKNQVLNSILEIKNINISYELDNAYNRKEKIEKYLSNTKNLLSKITLNKMMRIFNDIIEEPYKKVISHGDLIPTNIIIENDNTYFIDWEYISYKPIGYDLIYFLLFSKTNNSLDILKNNSFNIDIKDLYRDGIIICLKEINNWNKLIGKVDINIVNKNINRWKKELNYILKEWI